MTACDDFLFFDLPEDWEQIISVSKTSEVLGDRSNKPIDSFELGVNLDNSYLAILIQTTQGRPTWRFGGELRQIWGFPKGQQTSSNLGKIQSERQVLSINKLQIVKLSQPTSDNFDLIYYPPPWFRDVIVIAWIYTGEVENFVKDTLFDIGNQFGIGNNQEPTSGVLNEIQNTIQILNSNVVSLENLQNQDFSEVINAINALNTNSNLLQQLNQIDAGIFTLFEAIRNLIPASQANELEGTLKTRLQLEEEFL